MNYRALAIALLVAAPGCVSPAQRQLNQHQRQAETIMEEYKSLQLAGSADEGQYELLEQAYIGNFLQGMEVAFGTVPPERKDVRYEGFLTSKMVELREGDFEFVEFARKARSGEIQVSGVEETITQHNKEFQEEWLRLSNLAHRYVTEGFVSQGLYREYAPMFDFTILTEPEGASVEVIDAVRRYDPRKGEIVDTGEFDWVRRGQTPLFFDDFPDTDGDGIVTVRISKPGYFPEILNLRLEDQKDYPIELERDL